KLYPAIIEIKQLRIKVEAKLLVRNIDIKLIVQASSISIILFLENSARQPQQLVLWQISGSCARRQLNMIGQLQLLGSPQHYRQLTVFIKGIFSEVTHHHGRKLQAI